MKAFDSAYPGSMHEAIDGQYIERTDPVSLAAALLEVIATRDRQIEDLQNLLRQIGDRAHDASTGPTVPDVLWELRNLAYGGV